MEIRDPKLWAAFDRYCEWLSLPRHMGNLSTIALEGKGFSEELIELLQLQTKKSFCEKFAIGINTLKEWDKHPELQKRIKANWKKWTKHLTPGVMGKFYEKLMVEADAPRMKIWLQHIEEEDDKDQKTVNMNIGFENIIKSMKEDEISVKEDKTNGETKQI